MDFYADDNQVSELEGRLGSLAEGHPERIALAWHLRQRDGRRARQMADTLLTNLAENRPERARLYLVQAEVAALAAEFQTARENLAQARSSFEQQGDAVGIGDCYMLAALLANLQGDGAGNLSASALAAQAYGLSDDLERQQLALACEAHACIHAAPDNCGKRLAQAWEASPDASGAVITLLRLTEALQQFSLGHEAHAAALLMQLADPAERYGMIYFRFRIALGLAAALTNLDDNDGAHAWADQALALARRAGWPLAIGDALALLGGMAREAGQPERAMSLLEEAVRWLAVAPQFRGNAVAHGYLSLAEVDFGQVHKGLGTATSAIRLGEPAGAWSAVFDGWCATAKAQLRLGQQEQAQSAANTALQVVEQHGLTGWLPEAHRTLADVASREQERMDRLLQALAAARQIEDHKVELTLLDSLSQAWEQAGQLDRALDFSRQARVCVAKREQRRQFNREAALDMHYRAELQRQLADHQRSLVALESLRAGELNTSMQVLENLGRIGREITASLDMAGVLHTLVAHLGKLMQVSYVGVLVLEDDGKTLLRRAVEEGRPLAERRVAIDDSNSKAAQCARERREILVETNAQQRAASHVPGTREMRAAWFGPMLVGEELVGVLSIQSAVEHAYGAREQLIFRTLNAYVAVAVANARAYARLREQHARLQEVEAEMRKLATTDALTGIPNRRQFLASLSIEAQRSRRNGRPLSVVMADLDHFKRVNDTLGHAAGDLVLVQVAKLLDDNRRASDMVGRIGGEEFAILLPETDVVQAADVADRLRSKMQAEWIVWEGKPLSITMSFGCAELPTEVKDSGLNDAAAIEALLQAADQALYEAKHAGRNHTALLQHGQCTLYSCGLVNPAATAG